MYQTNNFYLIYGFMSPMEDQKSPIDSKVCLCFTLSLPSYSAGLPLLYVGGLTVPLGFARNEEMRYNQTYDYGYEGA